MSDPAPSPLPDRPRPPQAGGLRRRAVLHGALGLAASPALWGLGGRARAQSAALPFAGMNLSGLASNPYVENARIGTHYRDITEQHIEAAGDCPLFRLPATAHRFTRAQGWPLEEAYAAQVETVLDRLAAHGKLAILELHDYMRLPRKVATQSGYARNAAGQLVGPDGQVVPNPAAASVWAGVYELGAFGYIAHHDARDGLLRLYEHRVIGTAGCKLFNDGGLPDLWARIVQRFGGHPAIFGWGLMNEPYQGPERNADGSPFLMAPHWLKTAANTVERIARADRRHYIFVCGNEYASARRWPQVSLDLFDIPDPYGLVVYEAHNYLDNGGTGGGAWRQRDEAVHPDTGIEMVRPFVEALRAAGKRGFLGEHGYPEGNASAALATTRMLQYLQQHRVPSTQWCFGPGWPAGSALGMSTDLTPHTVRVKDNIAAVRPFFGARLSDYVPPQA
ncbi:glycoside hydrolase family 5 protein [Luteimonas sp. Y-2-2-4F]|nr:cellulase family glycosylhydrolase [Luteimonas sp. Y-2-2-4F]MCD9031522.1 glycoside hydrolase family 5 protein [Luteimonas sp. Y-2-2-4F]